MNRLMQRVKLRIAVARFGSIHFWVHSCGICFTRDTSKQIMKVLWNYRPEHPNKKVSFFFSVNFSYFNESEMFLVVMMIRWSKREDDVVHAIFYLYGQ